MSENLPEHLGQDTEAPEGLPASGASDAFLKAIRKRKGRVTVGDVVADTGHSTDEVDATLKRLLETRQGHLEVGDSGTLVYRFNPRLLRRDVEPLSTRMARATGAVLTKAFKVWIVLMLVVYFVVFVALVIAALLASQSREGGRGGGRSWGGRRRGFGGIPDLWLWYIFWSPNWGRSGSTRSSPTPVGP